MPLTIAWVLVSLSCRGMHVEVPVSDPLGAVAWNVSEFFCSGKLEPEIMDDARRRCSTNPDLY